MSGNYHVDLDKGSRRLTKYKVIRPEQIKPTSHATFSQFTARRAKRKAERKAAEERRNALRKAR